MQCLPPTCMIGTCVSELQKTPSFNKNKAPVGIHFKCELNCLLGVDTTVIN